MLPPAQLTILAVALAVEMLVGYPGWLFRILGHPVTWIGLVIRLLDIGLNRESDDAATRRSAGIITLFALLVIVLIPALFLQLSLLSLRFGVLVLGIFASAFIASKSLEQHVRAVVDGLVREGLTGGRKAVSMIVGRNPETLDIPAVCRAAIESLAENFSDGVVAPAFWLGVGGLPGIALYKAANTADSMIGHRTPRHEAFGWAAARFDDLVNLPASRLSACFLVAAAWLVPGADAAGAWAAVRRDAGKHRSPNAGWPEAAMAGALGLKLAGPRTYGTTLVEDAYMGEGRVEATPNDIVRALNLFRVACLLQLGLVLMLFALFEVSAL